MAIDRWKERRSVKISKPNKDAPAIISRYYHTDIYIYMGDVTYRIVASRKICVKSRSSLLARVNYPFRSRRQHTEFGCITLFRVTGLGSSHGNLDASYGPITKHLIRHSAVGGGEGGYANGGLDERSREAIQALTQCGRSWIEP